MARLLIVLALAMIAAPAAHAAATAPWPPRTGPGDLYVHYGEEHYNDIDGEAVLTRLVTDVARYRPALVTMSGDKVRDGVADQLEKWRDIMSAYDRAGVPYMAAVGNHDGMQMTPEAVTEPTAGITPTRDTTIYEGVFAERPYPMGDAPPYLSLNGPARPSDDPEGASTHYFVDTKTVRWVFIDNSCYGIINCDPLQNPPDGQGRTQYEFLRDAAAEAGAAGRLVFVVMHMPTRDPRDQEHSTTIHRNHVMGKGGSPDNALFEREAEALGVDGVFLGHIKGQWQYKGRGDIPYYIDGGAGGELYTSGPLGVDHGYWYGWRMLRVEGTKVTTDVVPVIVPEGIVLEGPQRLAAGGDTVRYAAFARQPATKSGRAVVERLELRDPNPIPKGSGGSGAQGSEPTATPREVLPNPARIFTTSNPLVLAPVGSDSDDPRRDAATQTADGAFAPRCPGRAFVSVTSGFHQRFEKVTVASRNGAILRRVRRGKGRTLARVDLAQPAVVSARLLRSGRVVKRFPAACRRGSVRLSAPAGLRRGAVLEVVVRSDRKPRFRRLRL